MRLGSRIVQGAVLCGALVLKVGTRLVNAQSPSPLPPYVPDELSVKFFSEPSETELETFEVKFRLDHVRALLAPKWHLFHIEDGADAAMKAEWILEDPSVCAVQLSFLGEWAATRKDLEDTECQNPKPIAGSATPSEAGEPTAVDTTPADALKDQSSSSRGAEPGGGAWTPVALAGLVVAIGVAGGILPLARLLRRRAARSSG